MKPKPVVTETICSECGLDWDRHEEAALSECVRLLKKDLAARPHPIQWTWSYPSTQIYTPNTWPYSSTQCINGGTTTAINTLASSTN